MIDRRLIQAILKDLKMPNHNGGSELIASARVGRWLAPLGTALAMIACYGVTATFAVLSLIGISVTLPYRAPYIIFFAAVAAVSLLGSFKQHRSRLVIVAALAGLALIVVSKFLAPDLKPVSFGMEAAGFLCMVGGNVMALRARRKNGVTCAIQR